ncbi:hypothetical protein Tsubulata_020601 [Turnera subulata]|uniref:RRM domain-containing protein n=1 Tax=Turnera subulata TaxID=218843 RepID=A0A9Q0G8F3_9ROSI|nr:hypothetical protein Tsubulata_020601 [Turnera subulata]
MLPTAPMSPGLQPHRPSHPSSSTHHNPSPFNQQPHPIPKPSPYFSKWSRKQVESAIDSQSVTSFYVENLPRRWVPADVYMVLMKYGEVVDVFIPQKESKSGRRFGFVRFQNKGDNGQILNAINKLEVDGGTLRANVARDRNKPINQTHHKQLNRNHNTAPHNLPTLNPTNQPNPSAHSNLPSYGVRSFASAVQGKPTSPVLPIWASNYKPNVSFTPTPDTLGWLARCAFGNLRGPMDSKKVQTVFLEHGFSDVIISQVGGDSVMACFTTTEAMNAFCQSNFDWIQGLFYDFHPWQVGNAASSRSCWVRIIGVPPQAWSQDFFRLITIYVGRMISLAPETENRTRLDAALVYIQTTTRTRVEKEITASIGGIMYSIYVSESEVPFIPVSSGLVSTAPDSRSPCPAGQQSDGSSRSNNGKSGGQEGLSAVNTSQDQFGIMTVIERMKGKDTIVDRDTEVRYHRDSVASSSHSGVGFSKSFDGPLTASAGINYADHTLQSPESRPQVVPLHQEGIMDIPFVLANSFGPLVSYADSESSGPTIPSEATGLREALSEYRTGPEAASFASPPMLISVESRTATQDPRSEPAGNEIVERHKTNLPSSSIEKPRSVSAAALVSTSASSHAITATEYLSTECINRIVERRMAILLRDLKGRNKKHRKVKRVTRRGSVCSYRTLSDDDIRRVNARVAVSIQTPTPTLSFNRIEAEETTEVGRALGWHAAGQQEEITKMAERLVSKEASDWCQARIDG